MSEVFEKAIEDLFANRIQIETERLILNKIVKDDQRDIWEIFGDEEVTRHTDFSTRKDYDDAKKVVDYFLSCYTNKEQYRFGIRLKRTNELIGTLGLFSFDEDSSLAEIGYELKRKHWNNGYMSESLRGVIQAFFTIMHGHRLEAVISPENTDSEKLLTRCGFVKEGMYRKRDFIKGSYLNGVIFGLIEEDIGETTCCPPMI